MEGFKTYRHEDNPKEKELHDKFIKEHDIMNASRIVYPVDGRGNTDKLLTEHEYKIMISAIQWLGSHVGQHFLEECGFKLER